MSLVFENPTQTVLELPNKPTLWARSAAVTDTAARWRLYLYQLGAEALLKWCQEDSGLEEGHLENISRAGNQSALNVQVWPDAAPLDIWHVVGGLVLTLGERRIVVILSEAMDAAEMRVPQEWIDLPGWAGDYYIAAHIDIDEQQLVLWGYSTYAQVKNNGQYDAFERTYCLGENHLIQDFSAFWVALQFESVNAMAVNTLPALSSIQRNNLIDRLAQSLDPRLEIPFELWGALLSDADARSRLYQKRQGSASTKVAVTLSEWSPKMLSQGWERLESLLPQRPAASVRTATNLSTEEDSFNPKLAVTGGKTIVLSGPVESVETVALVLALSRTIEADDRRNIRIRLYPTRQDATLDDQSSAVIGPSRVTGEFPENETATAENCLPSGTTLTLLLTDTGELLQSVEAGAYDNYIQLPPFRCPADQHFSVRVQRGEQSVQEDFIS